MLTIIKQRLTKKILKGIEQSSNQPLTIYLFGYGANIDPDFMATRLTHFECVGVGELKDYELKFNVPCEYIGKGFGGIVPAIGTSVYGTVYKISKPGIELMDILEWVPFHFYRREKKIISVAGKEIPAEVYMPVCPRDGLFPPKGYMNLLVRGAEKMKLPTSYIKFIKTREFSERFDIDFSYNLANPNEPRFFSNYFYVWHDKIREKLCQFL